MKKTTLKWIRRGIAVAAAALIGLGGFTPALAGGRYEPPVRYSGLINDYTPAALSSPYVMSGKWSLEVHEREGKATFSAVMDMETTAEIAGAHNAHTHHINMTDGAVASSDSGSYSASCPTITYPAKGFSITGTAYVTGNGDPAPFAKNGELSPLTVCILGGTKVTYSNMTFAFGLPASNHFGTQAIHGVVVRCVGRLGRELDACTLDDDDD